MKKIRYLLILLLFIPCFVKAEGNCGTYTNNLEVNKEGNTIKVTIPPSSIVGQIFVTFKEIAGNDGTCPEMFYECKYNTSAGIHDIKYDVSGCYLIDGYKLYSEKIHRTSSSTNPLIPSNKYENIDVCEGGPYKYIQKCGCMPAALTDLTSRVFNLIKIIAPALLIIVGGFDLIKAVTAADEKAIQNQQTKLIKKFVAAFTIFILFTLVQFVIGLVAKDKEGTIKCIEYIVNGWNGE